MNPLRAQFDALIAEYRTSVPRRLARMDELLGADRTDELRRELHSLGGSAGTFGLPELGDAARAAEDCLVEHPDAAQRNAFGNAFARLKRLCASLSQEGVASPRP